MFVTENNVGALVQYAKAELLGVYDVLEANAIIRLLFEHYFGFSRTDLVLKAEEQLSESDLLKIHFAIKKLKENEPIQYILGETDFYGLKLKVSPAVLIPRPETEELVNWIINECKSDQPTILDIGTGSGCIPLALKSKLPGANITGIDVSAKALDVAQSNSKQHQMDITWKQVNMLKEDMRNSTFSIIVSNPPYISESEKDKINDNVLNYEPHIALFVSNDDPLLFYRKIADFGLNHLRKNGLLFFEIHEKFGSELVDLLSQIGYKEITLRKDINGKDRMLLAHV